METVITKSYQGAQTRLLLPKVKDVAGVIGDNNSTRLCFKLPKTYATGWSKYIEFDCYVIRDDAEIKPTYFLDENDSFVIPYEITESNIGKEVDYNLKFVSNDGEIIEKSEMATLYFRDSTNGTTTEPEPYSDVVTFLYNNAFCDVSYSDGTTIGEGSEQLPKLTFTPMNPTGEAEEISLNIPYLDENGIILNKFINKEIVVEVFKRSSPNDLIYITQAQVPDMCLLSEWTPSTPDEPEPPYYMDLYMLVGQDPTTASNWYLIHTDNPTFKNINASENVDIAGTLDVGGEAGFDSDVRIGTHPTGATDTHANLTVNGDIHVDYDKKIFVDTIQAQSDDKPVTINDDVTLTQSKTLKVDRIESSTGGNNFPVTINDDLAIGTSLYPKTLTSYDKITGQNGLEIDDKDGNDDDISLVFNEYGLNVAAPSSFDENVVMDKNLTVGTQGASPANTLTVYGNQSVSGTLSAGQTTLSSLSTPSITNTNGNSLSISEDTISITGSTAVNITGTTTSITGDTTITGDTDIIGNTSVDVLDVSDKIINSDSGENVLIYDGLTVTGATDVPSMVINSSGTLSTDTILTVNGKTTFNNDVTLDTGKKLITDNIEVKSIKGTDTNGLSITTSTNVDGDISSNGTVTAPHIVGSTDVSTPLIIGTGTSGALTVTGSPTVSGLITGQSGLTISNGDTSLQKLTVGGQFISGSITDNRSSVTISNNVNAGNHTITATTFDGNATTATTARNYDTTGGTIKGHVDTYASSTNTGHVNIIPAGDPPSDASNTAVPTQAEMVNFVNSSIATQTGKFVGTVDVVTDLGLTTAASNADIANALLTYYQSQSPTNNDYCYVTIDTEPSTPSKDEFRRFKFNGTVWIYEYTLNNSSFTSTQWQAINSLIRNSSYNVQGVDPIYLDVVDIKNFMDNAKIQVPTTTTAGLALISKNNAQAEWRTLKTVNSTSLLDAGNIQLVSNVSYDSSSKKIQKTIDGTTSDVVTLASVATSGSYTDLLDKPTIGDKTLTIYGQSGSGTAQLAQSFNANQSDADKSLTIQAGTGLSASTSSNTITLRNAGVRAITDATSGDGVITVNTNGTSADVTVYTLPAATDQVLGGIKVGTDLSISSGVLSQSNITRTDGTDTGTLTVGGTFDVVSNLSSSPTGHITGQTVKTYTLPATYTPSSHTHGNLTNDGKVGSTADLPLVTGANGAVVAGSVSSPITLSSGVIGHATSGVTAGQYTKVTVDAKGHITAGTTISSGDVGTAIGASPSVSGQAVIVDSDGSLTFGEAGKVDDVQINGVSIVSNKIAVIPITVTGVHIVEVD